MAIIPDDPFVFISALGKSKSGSEHGRPFNHVTWQSLVCIILTSSEMSSHCVKTNNK